MGWGVRTGPTLQAFLSYSFMQEMSGQRMKKMVSMEMVLESLALPVGDRGTWKWIQGCHKAMRLSISIPATVSTRLRYRLIFLASSISLQSMGTSDQRLLCIL